MVFHIITLFPESFDSYINSSIIGRALKDKKIKIKFYNPRDFTKDKHRRVDQKPYSGGPGMVLEAPAILNAFEKALKEAKKQILKDSKTKSLDHSIFKSSILTIWLEPGSKQFDTKEAEKYAKKYDHIIIICGRYEGIDARAKKVLKTADCKLETISIGPYTLTGGELPAMIMLDTVSRRIPGVLGKLESVEEYRTASHEVYTRPEVLEYKGKKYRVPKVLISGNHKEIQEWKEKH